MALAKRHFSLFSLILATVFAFYYCRDFAYLTEQKLYYHDSLLSVASFHLMFQNLFHFRLPLWSPQLNAGQPLWPYAELVGGCDPIALLCYAFGYVLGWDSLLCYQVTAQAWLVAFALGGALLSRKITKHVWLNALAFLILYGGGLHRGLPAQSYGFLVPFRYTPFALAALIRYIDLGGWRNAMLSGALVAIGAGGYQTFYSYFFLALFFVCYIGASHGWRSLPKFLFKQRFQLLGLTAAVILGALPTWVSIYKMCLLVPVARISETHSYFMPLDQLLTTFLRGASRLRLQWHGSAYVGVIAAAAAIIAWFGLMAQWLARKPLESNLEIVWALMLPPVIALTLGWIYWSQGSAKFLGLRNWGFCLTLFHLVISQLAVSGLANLEKFRMVDRKFIYPLAFFLALLTLKLLNHLPSLQFKSAHLTPFIVCIALALVFRERFTLRRCLIPLCFLITAVELISASLSFPYPSSELGVMEGAIPHMRRSANMPWQNNRAYSYDYRKTYPYHFERPAMGPLSYARIPLAVTEWPYGVLTGPVTHHFRIPRYQALLETVGNQERLALLLGVTAPILTLTSQFYTVKNMKEAIDYLRSAGSLPVVESQSELPFVKLPQRTGAFEIDLLEFSPGHLLVTTSSSRAQLLIYRDGMDEDWHASIDGKASQLRAADLYAKAVWVPNGVHQISLDYRPLQYLIAFWTRAIFCLLCLVAAFLKLSGMPKRLGSISGPFWLAVSFSSAFRNMRTELPQRTPSLRKQENFVMSH